MAAFAGGRIVLAPAASQIKGRATLSDNVYTDFARNLMASVKVTGPKPTPEFLKTEILSGLTVALALVPEAVAFAFVAGVHPLVGLYAAFIVGLITG